MEHRKMLLIINPTAGRLRGIKKKNAVIKIFEKDGFEVDVKETSARGDATKFASDAHGYDVIACCGGDGTLNETVAGVAELNNRQIIAYVPAGSCNDFANSVKLSHNPKKSAAQIVSGREKLFDLGLFSADGGEGRYFTYVASFGAFTSISYGTSQKLKNKFGHLTYVISGVRELRRLKGTAVRVTVDGKIIEGRFLFGAVSNSKSIAGMLKIPDSDVHFSDGIFELLLVKEPRNFFGVLGVASRLLRKKYRGKNIIFTHGSEITFRSEKPFAWSLDGEMAEGGGLVTVTNLQKAFTLIVPN